MASFLWWMSFLFAATDVLPTDAHDHDGGPRRRPWRRRPGGGRRTAAAAAEEEDGRAAAARFYDLSLATTTEKLDMLRQARWLARHGDRVDWDARRDRFVRAVREGKRRSRRARAGAATAGEGGAARERLGATDGEDGDAFGAAEGGATATDAKRRPPLPSRARRRRLKGSAIDGDVFDEYEYAAGACPEAGALGVPCAPDDLARRCNKYDREQGSFRACLAACAPAFCCIHDAPREENFLAPNCNTDENCAQYDYCYIAWWKLEDTVGPATFLALDQDDEFYDLAGEDTESFLTENDVLTPLLLHHFDDINAVIADGVQDGEFDAANVFLNETYWVYPVTGKVDVDSPGQD